MQGAHDESGDFKKEPHCAKCGGTGWLINWLAISFLTAFGIVILYFAIQWFNASTSFGRGRGMALPFVMSGLCFYGVFYYRWRRCRCNP